MESTALSAGGGARTIIAELMFDTGREPKPDGIRTLTRPGRHLLYRAAEYDVDVRIEHDVDADGSMVVGQVMDSTRPRTALEGLPVGSRDESRTVTDHLGEFEIRHDGGRPLELHLQVSRDLTVAVSIDGAGRGCIG